MTEIRYVFDGLPVGPTLNDRGWSLNGWKAREEKRKARAAMRDKINETPIPSDCPLKGPLEMEVIFYLGTWRDRDVRQLSVQLKAYEDELVDAGIIEGDSWKEIPRHVVNVKYRKKSPGFEIVLRSLPDGKTSQLTRFRYC